MKSPRHAPFLLFTLAPALAFACSLDSGPSSPSQPENLGGDFAIYPASVPFSGGTGSDPDNPWLTFGQGASGGAPTAGGTELSVPGGGDSVSLPNSPGGGPGSLETSGSAAASGGFALDAAGSAPAPEPPELRLQGYLESTSAAKLLVVQHIRGGPSADCALEIYSNGGTDPWRRLVIPDGLASGGRRVLCVPDAFHAACELTAGGSAFNGNDALRLTCAGVTQDVLGTIGVDPGKGWTGPGFSEASVSTVDSGLWRCASPHDTGTPLDAFSLEEWASWDPLGDPTLEGASCEPPGAAGGAAGAPGG